MYRVVIPFSFDRLYEVGEMIETLPPDGMPIWISMGLVEPVEEPEPKPKTHQKPRMLKVQEAAE
jgi:hypothetical protein